MQARDGGDWRAPDPAVEPGPSRVTAEIQTARAEIVPYADSPMIVRVVIQYPRNVVMKLYRFFAFTAALAIALLLASAPGLMLRAEARHRQLTATEQHVAVAHGTGEVSRDSIRR